MRHFKRKVLVCILSIVFLISTALHTLISLDWSRKQYSDINGPEEFLLREGRKVADNNGNGARQLASYENHNLYESNENINDGTLLMLNAQVEKPKKDKNENRSPKILDQKPGPILQDIKGISVRQNKDDQDDEIEFRGCDHPGTLDMSAYPFVDARAIYCGNSKAVNNIRAPGAIPPYLLEKLLKEEGSDIRKGGKIKSMEIEVEPAITLMDVVVEGTKNFVNSREFSVKQENRIYRRINRTIILKAKKEYKFGSLLFFPPILSEQWVLMNFLRTIYKECAVTSTHIAATVKHVSVQGNNISGSFCVYLEAVGGGIKDSYVLWQSDCKARPLPKKITKCIVSDINL